MEFSEIHNTIFFIMVHLCRMKMPLVLESSSFKFLPIRINSDDEIYKTDTAVRGRRLNKRFKIFSTGRLNGTDTILMPISEEQC